MRNVAAAKNDELAERQDNREENLTVQMKERHCGMQKDEKLWNQRSAE